jgi:hypothetical protein
MYIYTHMYMYMYICIYVYMAQVWLKHSSSSSPSHLSPRALLGAADGILLRPQARRQGGERRRRARTGASCPQPDPAIDERGRTPQAGHLRRRLRCRRVITGARSGPHVRASRPTNSAIYDDPSTTFRACSQPLAFAAKESTRTE